MLRGREGNHRFLPQHIEASSPKRLHEKIKKLQRLNRSEYRFISFYYDQKRDMHVAWFYFEISESQEIKEFVDGLTTK